MASQRDDLWSEIAAPEENLAPVAVFYRRRKPETTSGDVPIRQSNQPNRLSFAPNRKICWNRSLSTRGRSSVIVSSDGVDYWALPRQREEKRKPRQAFRNKKLVHHAPDFSKERTYFQEVDSFELLEESPSPKNFRTWATGAHQNANVVGDLPSILERWLIAKKLTYSCAPSSSRPKIMPTPIRLPMEAILEHVPYFSNEKSPEKSSLVKTSLELPLDHHFTSSCSITSKVHKMLEEDATCGDLEEAINKLSLGGDKGDPFSKLLTACGQIVPAQLSEVFQQYSDLSSVVKIGEGTYGEAFKAGGIICKIVPIDGDLRVNGEVQKRSAEVLEEVLLCWALNSLRGLEANDYNQNTCTNFIETKDVRVCQGAYDPCLISGWEDWDKKHGSENDHPKEFSDKQCYIVFVLADGGKDLEGFVILNFDEARSLLVQVTAALAVAEMACEFEHRDLHWGNILLARSNGPTTAKFNLEGREMWANTFGLSVSIIDFTLSRINTGEVVLFMDLSADPELFEGPKGDKQSETYRKMKEVTDECWEGSYPKTNVLWLQYLVDVLLLKKTFKRTVKDERDLRSFRKSLNSYGSAKDALIDPFFNELWISHEI